MIRRMGGVPRRETLRCPAKVKTRSGGLAPSESAFTGVMPVGSDEIAGDGVSLASVQALHWNLLRPV